MLTYCFDRLSRAILGWRRATRPQRGWPSGPLTALLFLPFLALGCSAAESLDMADPPSGSGGDAGTKDETIAFSPPESLNLAPSELSELAVLVTPAMQQWVTFEIVTTPADFDGFVLDGRARVQDDGLAKVQLRAPSKKSDFIIRAVLASGASATRDVHVTSMGFGRLVVLPMYGGARAVESWNASLYVGKTCEQISSHWEDDPAAKSDNRSPILDTVPAQTLVSVILRGDEVVSGCATVTDLTQRETRELSVEVTDRPVSLDHGTLDLVFEIGSTAQDFASHLDRAIKLGTDQLRAEEESGAELLLSGMSALAADSVEFEQALLDLQFLSLAADVWGGSTALADRLTEALTSVAQSIKGNRSLIGTLVLHGEQSPFQLLEAPGSPPSSGGSTVWVVTRSSGDAVTLGGEIRYSPLGWLLSLVKDEGNWHEAMQCDELMGQVADAADGAVDDCNVGCLRTLCKDALTGLLDDIDSRPSTATVVVSATANAIVNGPAWIESISGSWIASMDTVSATAAMSGELRGRATP